MRCGQQRERKRGFTSAAGAEGTGETGEAIPLERRRRGDLCVLNRTPLPLCNAPSFPSALLLTLNGQWPIASKAAKAAGLQTGIVSFTVVCSRWRQDLLSEETRTQRFWLLGASQRALQHTKAPFVHGWLEKQLLQSTLPQNLRSVC